MGKLKNNNIWYLENIPRRLFLYWGRNKPLSFLRYMTVLSFSKLNPDWDILIYYPSNISYIETWKTREQKENKYNGKDFFTELDNINNVITIESKFTPKISEIFKSDIFRVHALATYGGVWSDFDILYTKPITRLHINSIENKLVDAVICQHKYSFAGFLMSKAYSYTYCKLAVNVLGAEATYYTSILDNYYYDVFSNPLIEDVVVNLDMESVYPISWEKPEGLLDNILQEEHTIGIHWYAGSNIMSSHEGEELCKCDSALCKEARRIYEI